jgi:hypothetical protein
LTDRYPPPSFVEHDHPDDPHVQPGRGAPTHLHCENGIEGGGQVHCPFMQTAS